MKQKKIWVPATELRKQILREGHEGHSGMVGTKNHLRQTYWWAGMGKEVEQLVQSCPGCQRSSKSKPTGVRHQLDSIPRPQKPGVQYGVDLMGPCADGNLYLVLIDYATGYPFVQRGKSYSAQDVARFLKEKWDQFGYPEAIVSDNGPQFIGRNFEKFLADHDVHHYRAAVYNPTENGLVERWNRYLKGVCKLFQKSRTGKKGSTPSSRPIGILLERTGRRQQSSSWGEMCGRLYNQIWPSQFAKPGGGRKERGSRRKRPTMQHQTLLDNATPSTRKGTEFSPKSHGHLKEQVPGQDHGRSPRSGAATLSTSQMDKRGTQDSSSGGGIHLRMYKLWSGQSRRSRHKQWHYGGPLGHGGPLNGTMNWSGPEGGGCDIRNAVYI